MPDPMRLLVCGGRDYRDGRTLFAALDAIHRKRGIAVIISGAASGADSLASAWAKARGIELVEFPADWTQGRSGGPQRNRRMMDEGRPEGVVAFPRDNGEIGRGTADMMDRARKAGLPVWEPLAKPATIRTEAAA